MIVTHKAGKIDALRVAVKGLDGQEGRVGWFPSAVYEGGQPVAGVAAVHEFGSPSRGIRPRLGMRALAREKQEDWKQTILRIAAAVTRGEMAPGSMTEALSMAAAGHLRAAISKVTSPALKPATIAARKRKLARKSSKWRKGGAGVAGIAKPLVDSAILLNTVSYEVTKK